jgi:hypothetical protein
MRPGENIDWALMLERIKRNNEWRKLFAGQHLESTQALRASEDALYTYYKKIRSFLTEEQKDALTSYENRVKIRGHRKMEPYTDWTDGNTVLNSFLSAEFHLTSIYSFLYQNRRIRVFSSQLPRKVDQYGREKR